MESLDRMSDLMSAYYGTDDAEAAEANAKDLDSTAFNLDKYTHSLLLNAPLPELLQRDEQLVRRVRTLDSDMQMLVYENYNKFIGATDTIRKMKTNVEEMEADMEALVTKMDTVSTETAAINASMAPQRTKIEKIVSLQRLIKKLEFLFDLPERLRKSIELEAFAQAVKYYNTASHFLGRYGHIESFAAIQRESVTIISGLKTLLRTRLKEETLSDGGLAEIVPLLLGLGEPVAELSKVFLRWHKHDFGREFRWLARSKDDGLAAEDRRNAPKATGTDSVPALDIGSFTEQINEACLERLADVTSTFQSLFVESGAATNSALEDGDAAAEPGSGELSVDLLEFALMEFCKEVLSDYLDVLEKRFMQERAVVTGMQSTDATDGREPISAGSAPLLEALSSLLEALRAPAIDARVRRAVRLRDRGAEIAEKAIRHQVDAFFEGLRADITERLRTVHKRSTELAADAQSKASDDFEVGRSADCAGAAAQGLAELAEAYSRHILDDTDTCTRALGGLVRAASTVLPEMADIFEHLVQGQLQHQFLWLANAMEAQCDRYHPSRVAEGLHTRGVVAPTDGGKGFDYSTSRGGAGVGGALAAAATAAASPADEAPRMRRVNVKMAPLEPNPNFLLVLACICRELEGGVSAASLRVVDLPELLSQIATTSRALLKGYVEIAGNKAARASTQPAGRVERGPEAGPRGRALS